MTHLRTWLIATTVLLIAACTAKLQQNTNNNKNNTKKEALAVVSTPQDSLITLLKEKEKIFGKNATNYTYIPPRDTPAILKKDNPIKEVVKLYGYYDKKWQIFGGLQVYITPEEFMEKYLLPNIGVNNINDLRLERKNEHNKDGIDYWYYTQYYKGIPTTHSLSLSIKNGFASYFNSSFDPTLELNIIPSITEQQAWDSIKTFLAATDTRTNIYKYIGIMDRYDREEFPYTAEVIANMTYTVTGVIYWSDSIIYRLSPGDRFMYLFKLGNKNSNGPKIGIDPFTGKVLIYNNRMHCNETASVDAIYGLSSTYGTQNFCVENIVTGGYQLKDNSRSPGIETLLGIPNSPPPNGCYTGTTIIHNTLDWNTYTNPVMLKV